MPSRWPVRKGISSGCLTEQSCALNDQALVPVATPKKKKKKKRFALRRAVLVETILVVFFADLRSEFVADPTICAITHTTPIESRSFSST